FHVTGVQTCALPILSIITAFVTSLIVSELFDLPMNLIEYPTIVASDIVLQLSGTIISLLLWGMFTACMTVVTKSIVGGLIFGLRSEERRVGEESRYW